MHTTLDQGWEFACAPHRQCLQPAQLAQLEFRPATVPGTNLTDLQACALVRPATAADYEASFEPYGEMDFIYRTTFAGGAAAHRRHVQLCFEGLDTVCEVFLNGAALGQAENAFTPHCFDLAGRLREDANTLVLIFRSPVLESRARRERYGRVFPGHSDPRYNTFMFLRKPAYSFFWDWGPAIPVSGIYKPVTLKAHDHAVLGDWRLETTIEGTHVRGTVTVQAEEAEGLRVVLALAGQSVRAAVSGGAARLDFEIAEARLWWPNGEGAPALYDLELSLLEGENGTPLDVRRERVGFRTIEVSQEPRADGQGRRFLFKVNGKPVFCRGYNWIPTDNAIPRTDPATLARLLDLARDSHVNMLRVWGGGYYESDEFYRLCDERGIMVWQDAMFACTLYPDDDPAYLAEVRAELTHNIKRLRHHTSLALWCGNNECHWGFDEWWTKNPPERFFGAEIYDRLFPELLRELDPARFYWNGSPYSGGEGRRANNPHHGDAHLWTLHANCEDLSAYSLDRSSFISETGIQSLPDLRTCLTMGESADRHIQSHFFDTRNHYERPAKNERLLKFTGALFRVSEDFETAVVLSQLAHAEYLKVACEHWRSLAYDCAGILIWQFNDCWPAISWSSVDFNLIPKAAYYYLRRAFAPDLVGFKQRGASMFDPSVNARGELFVTSERDGRKRGEIELRVVRIDGEQLERLTFPVSLDGRGVASLGEIVLPGYPARRFDCVAEFTLRWDDGVAARNVYPFSRPKHMRLDDPGLSISPAAADALTIRARGFAKGVYLFHPDPRVVFEDNYFDLLPGEARRVAATAPFEAGAVRAISYFHPSAR